MNVTFQTALANPRIEGQKIMLAEAFARLFVGNERNHGKAVDIGEKDARGKKKLKCTTEPGPPTPDLWLSHLAGETGLGVVPIKDDGTCLWGAIDVDQYADLDHIKIAQRIQAEELPLIVCRSKSGGAHVYAFFREPVQASLLIRFLRGMEKRLGFAKSEIFPKQDRLEQDQDGKWIDNGNWINMPYFSEHTVRYAVNAERSIENWEFLEWAEGIKLSAEEVQVWVAQDIDESELEAPQADSSALSPAETSIEDGAAFAEKMLKKYIRDVAQAPEGNRNNMLNQAAFHLSTMAARDWIDQETIKEGLLAAAELCGLMNGDERRSTIKTLERSIGRGLRRPHDDLSAPPDDHSLLQKMNDEFSVVDIEGKACVIAFKSDALGRQLPTYYTFENFKNLHDHVRIGKQGIGSWWLGHRGRRQYAGITFRPGKRGEIAQTPRLLNLWRGFGIRPAPGDWFLMKQHILEVLAAGDQTHFDYILRWLAWAVQNPGERAETVLVFKSEEEGSGKGTLGNTLLRIFGSHGRRIDRAEHLTGKFNAHLQDVSFLFADEAFWPGDRAAEGALKGMITEPSRMVEPKGINPYEVQNCLHVMMASNNTWTVPAGASARRFAVFRVSPHRVGDERYFSTLYAELEGGGREAMLHDLLVMDLGSWHPRKNVPKTKELLEEKVNTLRPEEKWWLGILYNGQLPTYPPLAADECPTRYLYDDYITHAGKTGAKYKSIEVQIGRFLNDRVPNLQKDRRTFREKGKDVSGQVYSFPPLTECRAAFDKLLQQQVSWDEPHAWQEREADESNADDLPF